MLIKSRGVCVVGDLLYQVHFKTPLRKEVQKPDLGLSIPGTTISQLLTLFRMG